MRWRPCLLAGLVLFRAAGARADSENVSLAFEACESELAEEAERIVTLELDALPMAGHVSVEASCTELRVEIAAESSSGSDQNDSRRLRQLDLRAEDPRVRGRVLGLAIVDLIQLAAEEAAQAAAAPSPSPATVPTEPKEDARRARSPAAASPGSGTGVRAGLRGSVIVFPSEGPALFGAAAEALFLLAPGVGIGFDVQASGGVSSYTEGDVRRWHLGFAGEALLETTGRWWAVGLVAGFRIGPASLVGVSSSSEWNAGQVTGVVGGPFLAPRVRMNLSERWSIVLRVDGGATLWEVNGARPEGPQASFSGWWLSPGLGVEVQP